MRIYGFKITTIMKKRPKITQRIFLVIVSTNGRVTIKWDKVSKNGPKEICGRQPLKNLK